MNRKLFVLSALLTIAVLATACSPKAAPPSAAPQAPATQAPATEAPATEAPAAPLVLKIANTANITTWDPIASFSTEAAYMANVYEQLIRLNPPGSAEQFTPLLAESWEKNDDGTVWTFHLRQGVKFHDGEAMNAAAVKKSIEAAKDHGGASFIWAPLDTIEAADEYTVKFNLKYAAPVDLIAASLYGAWIVSPKALDAAAADENYWANGVEAGTGPYMIESYTPDAEIVFTRFDDYWGGWQPNQYEKVLTLIVPESTTQQQMLEGGEVDLVTVIPSESVEAFRNNPDYTVLEEPSFFNYVGFFNTVKKPLDNVKVRQALSYAIPYGDIIKIAVKGLGTQSRGPVPAGVWPWSSEVKQYTYDIEKAKALLKEAGYENGGFSINLTYASENPAETAFAPLIKDSFAQVGVDVTITPMEFSQQWELAKADPAKAQDMFLLLYWPTYSDAGSDNLWSMFYYTEKPFFNLSYWNSPDFNKDLDDAIALTVIDPAASQAKYVEAMNLLVDEAPGVFFFDTKARFIIPNRIEGFHYNLNYPFVHYFFYDLHPAG
ncbi:MAG: ABC transporter substrate-binding protein [Anaerolineales bacterium]|nr:MAG: ABC transporter substrate-binding protein [Anaerolineales bacterium]